MKRHLYEPLPWVLGNNGTGAFIFREQGMLSNYFHGTRELLIILLGTKQHQSTFKNIFFLTLAEKIVTNGGSLCNKVYS